MKLITWNIQWGLGMDHQCDLARMVAHARTMSDFDVLCLQEVSDHYDDLAGTQGQNQFAALAALLPDYCAMEGIAVDVLHPQGGRRRFGNMMLSRLPVARVMRHALPWLGDETPNMPRVLIDATVMAPFGPVHVMTTHLEYSSSKLRAAQVEGIRAVHAAAADRVAHPSQKYYGPFSPVPETSSAILTADFNMKPDDPLKHRLAAPFQNGAPSLQDAWQVMNGLEPHPPSFCIYDQRYGAPHCCDFIFATSDLVPRIRSITYDTVTQISDHQPVMIELADD